MYYARINRIPKRPRPRPPPIRAANQVPAKTIRLSSAGVRSGKHAMSFLISPGVGGVTTRARCRFPDPADTAPNAAKTGSQHDFSRPRRPRYALCEQHVSERLIGAREGRPGQVVQQRKRHCDPPTGEQTASARRQPDSRVGTGFGPPLLIMGRLESLGSCPTALVKRTCHNGAAVAVAPGVPCHPPGTRQPSYRNSARPPVARRAR